MAKRKKKASWGGYRPGAGAKPTGRKGGTVAIYLADDVLVQIEAAARAGESRSATINRLLRRALRQQKARN